MRPLVEAGAVLRELAVDRSPSGLDIARRIDDVHEQARALEVGEELVAEADALARALDQTGHVGDDELAPVRRVDRPENGRQRRERVFGDLRPGVRDPGEKRRLARVRKADERRVSEQLEPQLELGLLARKAGLREPGRAAGWRREPLVPAPAGAPAREHDARRR